MGERRGFGMAPDAVEVSRPRPAWANPMLWAFCGALAGAGLFFSGQRGRIERAARARLPEAQRQARLLARQAQGLAAQAQDMARDVSGTPAPEPAEPKGPSADTLSAPVDPTLHRRAAPRGQTRSLGGRRRVGEVEMPSASEVQDVRARWDAPDVSYEAPTPWSQTDMARGVYMCGGLAIFFWLFGWLLFRLTGGKPRSF